MIASLLKRFHFERDQDISGVSGCGIVAAGCLFTDSGEVVVHWVGSHASTTLYHNLDDVITIHGHGNATRIVWDDD